MAKESTTPTEINIRKATRSDAKLLAELGKLSFYEAFSTQTAPHDMEAHLQTAFNVNEIIDQLNNDQSVFFIVEIKSSPGGYAYLYPTTPPKLIKEPNPIQLIRFYLRKNYYGQGVGNELMKACLKEAHAQGYRSVWLSSWELNDRANAFYKKWQFSIVGRQKFVVGSDSQTDFVFIRRI